MHVLPDFATGRVAMGKVPVLVAGEPEQLARAARIADGIEIDDTTWAQLATIAESYQIRLDS